MNEIFEKKIFHLLQNTNLKTIAPKTITNSFSSLSNKHTGEPHVELSVIIRNEVHKANKYFFFKKKKERSLHTGQHDIRSE